MRCPYCSWEGEPEDYIKHYDEKHSFVSSVLAKSGLHTVTMSQIHEGINSLLNEINLHFTPTTSTEELAIRRVILKLTEAAEASKEF